MQDEGFRLKNSNLESLSRAEPLIVYKLIKSYNNNHKKQQQRWVKAVNQLSFGIKREQCFGLLGLNGDGKMITGESEPDFGDVLINGYSIRARNLSYFIVLTNVNPFRCCAIHKGRLGSYIQESCLVYCNDYNCRML